MLSITQLERNLLLFKKPWSSFSCSCSVESYARPLVSCLTFLVVALLAEVNDHLSGSGVERVEVGPMLAVQALECEVVDATESLHQFPAMDTEFDWSWNGCLELQVLLDTIFWFTGWRCTEVVSMILHQRLDILPAKPCSPLTMSHLGNSNYCSVLVVYD